MGSSLQEALAHLKSNRSKTALTEVQRDNEEVADDKESIKGEVETFYTILYQHTEVDQLALTQLTDIVLPALTKCSADESKDLIAAISTKDIQRPLRKLQGVKRQDLITSQQRFIVPYKHLSFQKW
ncbi:hypothetical protein DSO57_1025562 [Entomophthora muscae]|uniref:Uncharacterized protein n=2 Tax=Entomophthora muscae TaxID=34485 RepID=A0ACC2RT70_9FUNG|nr:hypothetical protein DSO57_1039518 [Entomophthora muscae]KAJ9053302.1 hypothetical protein DSO57_1025562 [Entomophthora muscae]